jgi:hypothetical protein
MSSTAELAQIWAIVQAGGGKILYTGDQHQLTSVGSGGLLALLAADNGAHELAEVHRFTHDWERQASLRLRAGDTSVISEYEDRGRLHGGTREQMQGAAARGYLADTLDGKQSLLIVGSNTDAAGLAEEILERLIEYGHVEDAPLARLGKLAERVEVSVGDVVQARLNDPLIRVDGGGGIVTNRATCTVLGRDDDGALRMRGAAGEIAQLPAEAVAEHLTLDYASTVHAAQRRTVHTSRALLDEAAAREAAYVALSRGRDTNTAYLGALSDSDEHQAERLDATTAGRLAGVLGNDEQLALFDPADIEAEQTVEMDANREAIDEPERIAEVQLPAECVAETGQERTVDEPTAEPDVEQLALLDVEPRIEDKVGAAALRAEADTAAVEREQQEERTRATLAEVPRAAEAAEQQRFTREAVAEARAAIRACFLVDRDAAGAERERRDEAERQEQLIRWAERQEQLIRWAEQDRTAERDRGADEGFDDGPSIDY